MSKTYDFETLINMRFKHNNGAVDLTKSHWSSVIINEANQRSETVDYSSVSRFKNGNIAYFDGEYSVINKITGSTFTIDLSKEYFQFAVWININEDDIKLGVRYYLLHGANDTGIFLVKEEEDLGVYQLYIHGDQKGYSGGEVCIRSNEWTWLSIYGGRNYCEVMFMDVDTQLGQNMFGMGDNTTFTFDNTSTCIGKGYDPKMLIDTHFKGYIDDVVLIKSTKPWNIEPKGIPADDYRYEGNTYYLDNFDPALIEDTDNVWEETEKEYSRYDQITDVIEWKRFNTKEKIDERENGLIPYKLTLSYKQLSPRVESWIKPTLENPYRINDLVIYNLSKIYINTVDFNTKSPTDIDSGWKLVASSINYITDWVAPTKYYSYMDKVIYNASVYQSQVNYNTQIPAAWTLLTSLTNDEKEDLNENNAWSENRLYSINDRVSYNGNYYTSILGNNIGYTPGDTTYWKPINKNNSYLSEWVLPSSYNKGNIVKYNNTYYYSNINYNILTPTTDIPEWSEITTWEQPKYKNAYTDGDVVYYNGKIYECNLSKDDNGNYRYSQYSEIAPDECRNKKYYKAISLVVPTSLNDYNPRNNDTSAYWKEIPEIDIDDTSKYNEWIAGSVYNIGDLVVTTDYDWKDTYTSDWYFSNKEATVNRDDSNIYIKIYDIWDNYYLDNDDNKRYFKKTYLEAFNNGYSDAYILFINNRFIKWSDITLVRSDKFITFIINKPSTFIVSSIDLYKIPCKCIYSESGYMPENGVKLFGFNNDGSFGNEINIYTTNQRIKELVYTSTIFDNFFIDVDIDYKLTKSNIFIFDEDGKFISKDNYTLSSANIFTFIPTDGKTYTMYCIWDSTENSCEDNIVAIPNTTRVKEYLVDKYNNKVSLYNKNQITGLPFPVKVANLDIEFDNSIVNHTSNKSYDDNIDASMKSIFMYNNNKFDSVYEEIRPVNIIEYSESEMNSLKRNIIVTLDGSNINTLLNNSYIVEGTNLILFDESVINKYVGTTVTMKLKQYFTITLDESNINNYIGSVVILNSENITVTNSNKNNLIGKTVKINSSSMFTENNTSDYDSIIMSRDIYEKNDYKNNTYAIVFKRGMLPDWYNTIKYTNDKFYFSEIPKASSRTIYMGKYDHQYIQVTTSTGESYNSNSTRSFTVEDGTDFTANYTVSVIADDHYKAGKITEIPGIVTSDSWIRASDAALNMYTVTVVPSAHQHIIVTYTEINDYGEIITKKHIDESFMVESGTSIKAFLSADKGYNIGKLNYSEGIVTSDITIQANEAASLAIYNITYINDYSDIVDMNIVYNGNKYTTDLTAYYDDTFSVNTSRINERYVDMGYTVDGSNQNEDGLYTVLGTTVVSVNKPIDNAFTFTIYDSDNMNIVAENMGIDNTLTASCNEGQSMRIINTDVIYVTVTPKQRYYTPTKLDITGSTIYTITSSTDEELKYTIIASENDILAKTSAAPTLRSYILNIPTSDNQTIVVTYINPIDNKTYTTSKSVTVPYGTTYTVTVTSTDPTNYTAGVATPAKGTITGDTTISVSDATRITYNITIKGTHNQTLTVTTVEPDGTTNTYSEGGNDLVITKPVGTTYSTTLTNNHTTRKVTVSGGLTITCGDFGGYINGSGSGTLNSDVTISATLPTSVKLAGHEWYTGTVSCNIPSSKGYDAGSLLGMKWQFGVTCSDTPFRGEYDNGSIYNKITVPLANYIINRQSTFTKTNTSSKVELWVPTDATQILFHGWSNKGYCSRHWLYPIDSYFQGKYVSVCGWINKPGNNECFFLVMTDGKVARLVGTEVQGSKGRGWDEADWYIQIGGSYDWWHDKRSTFYYDDDD